MRMDVNDLDQHEWKVTVGWDDSTEDPLAEYSDFELIDFRDHYRKWSSYGPNSILDCVFEDDEGACEQRPEEHTGDFFNSDHPTRHEFQPNASIVAYLDFQGGSSAGIRWYLSEGTCSIPGYEALYDFNDHEPSGVLVWEGKDEGGFWEWMKHRDNAAKTSIEQANEQLDTYVRAVLEDYSHWASGNTYWFRIERLNDDGDYDELDSCGGYYGWDHMKEGLTDMGMPENVVKAEDFELVEAGYY